jgi:putative membrane protein insertion efficiency factor
MKWALPASGPRGTQIVSDRSKPDDGADLVSLVDSVRLLPRRLGRGLVRVYRLTLSPLIGFHCRHLPTCSEYADEALARFGLWGGGWMTLARLLRCHPFGTSGLDFVPKEKPAGAAWWRPWRYARWRGTNAG